MPFKHQKSTCVFFFVDFNGHSWSHHSRKGQKVNFFLFKKNIHVILSYKIIYVWTLCVLRHQLEKSLLLDPWNTVKEVDLCMI